MSVGHHHRQRELKTLIEAEGVTIEGVDITKGSHFRFKIRRGKRQGILIVSGSPSDWRIMVKVRADVRRFVKQGEI